MSMVRKQIETTKSPDVAFAYVDDYQSVPDWMFGVSSFVPVDPAKTSGLGATFTTEMKLGPKALKSTVEVTEWVENERLLLTSIEGFDVTTGWSFSPSANGGTTIDITFEYNFPGGLAGRALAAVVEPAVAQAVKQTESALRERLESAAA